MGWPDPLSQALLWSAQCPGGLLASPEGVRAKRPSLTAVTRHHSLQPHHQPRALHQLSSHPSMLLLTSRPLGEWPTPPTECDSASRSPAPAADSPTGEHHDHTRCACPPAAATRSLASPAGKVTPPAHPLSACLPACLSSLACLPVLPCGECSLVECAPEVPRMGYLWGVEGAGAASLPACAPERCLAPRRGMPFSLRPGEVRRTSYGCAPVRVCPSGWTRSVHPAHDMSARTHSVHRVHVRARADTRTPPTLVRHTVSTLHLAPGETSSATTRPAHLRVTRHSTMANSSPQSPRPTVPSTQFHGTRNVHPGSVPPACVRPIRDALLGPSAECDSASRSPAPPADSPTREHHNGTLCACPPAAATLSVASQLGRGPTPAHPLSARGCCRTQPACLSSLVEGAGAASAPRRHAQHLVWVCARHAAPSRVHPGVHLRSGGWGMGWPESVARATRPSLTAVTSHHSLRPHDQPRALHQPSSHPSVLPLTSRPLGERPTPPTECDFESPNGQAALPAATSPSFRLPATAPTGEHHEHSVCACPPVAASPSVASPARTAASPAHTLSAGTRSVHPAERSAGHAPPTNTPRTRSVHLSFTAAGAPAPTRTAGQDRPPATTLRADAPLALTPASEALDAAIPRDTPAPREASPSTRCTSPPGASTTTRPGPRHTRSTPTKERR